MKKLPELKTDQEAETFVDEADLTEFDLSAMKPVSFEFMEKSRSVTMRLPEPLLHAIKDEAKREGLPYQRFIRQVLEQAVHEPVHK